jgi:DNA-binding MarR family transcriptional regulator
MMAVMATEPQWLDETEARAWRGYLRMHNRLWAALGRELVCDSGLSVTDYDVLVVLSETDGHRLRMRELGAQLLWEKSRLSHHVTRMERRGLVAREDCPTDARGAYVVLTPAGQRAIEEAAPAHVANVRRHLFDHLSREQVEALAGITDAVLGHLAGADDRPELT